MRFAFLTLLLTGCAATSWNVERAKDVPTERPLRAAFLIVDGVYNTELTAPMDLFQHTIFHTKPGIEVFTVAPTKAPIRTFEGLVITPDHDFDSAPAIDILVVPSAEHSMDTDLENTALIAWVKKTGDEARYVMSLCDGAFVLAKAGLVDGRWSTTFPSDQDRYAEMFPALEVKRGVSFVHDGKLLTSEGGAKSFDVAMYLIDHLYGVEVAKGVGRGLIIAWPPAAMPFAVRSRE
ncbi:MAG: DJ-1/PfpI family protein [Deltaproteobacteria bacterium]